MLEIRTKIEHGNIISTDVKTSGYPGGGCLAITESMRERNKAEADLTNEYYEDEVQEETLALDYV